MITAFHHPGFAADIGDRHVMPIGKFAMVAEALRGRDWVRLVEPAPVSEADVLRVHAAEYVAAIRTGEPRELAESQKFPWSPGLYRSVRLTSGGVLAAGREALRSGASAALASGFHHAHAARGEGFCTFNGLVIAAEAMRAAGEISTVAVLDMDLHYGNGTARLAVNRPWLTAVSIYGNDYWDNVVYRDVSIRRHEDGANHRSFALPAGCDGPMLRSIMDRALPALLQSGKPELLLYQAGADPYYEDPYSPLKLDHDDLRARDRAVFDFARRHGIPIAWVLAGGYTADTRKVVQVHVNTFEAWREAYADPAVTPSANPP